MLKTGEGLDSEDIAKGITHIDEKRVLSLKDLIESSGLVPM
jgi:hypothetical protein